MEINEQFRIFKSAVSLVHTKIGYLESYRKILKVFSMCVCIAWHIAHQPFKMHCVSFQGTCKWFENHHCKEQRYLHHSVVVCLCKGHAPQHGLHERYLHNQLPVSVMTSSHLLAGSGCELPTYMECVNKYFVWKSTRLRPLLKIIQFTNLYIIFIWCNTIKPCFLGNHRC